MYSESFYALMCGQLSATLLFKVQPIVNVLQKKFLWEKKKLLQLC